MIIRFRGNRYHYRDLPALQLEINDIKKSGILRSFSQAQPRTLMASARREMEYI